ncbi:MULTISPECIES: phosphatase PAP2 family protein [Providencia]|uniref:phosphatase PAP2 family protein n=1 Tax=Providencia TaxID=586 RepID=UPI0012B62C44|nr:MULTISPECIES: phosphatase PAP2 family protein [Providencia]MTC57550.1 phosphatase PAP2 family protein [Providencia rustigianii]
MKKTIYLIAIFTFLLMLPPIIMIGIGWQWTPEQQPTMKGLLWLTDTAGMPYSIITFILLTLLTLFVFRQSKAQWVKLIVIILVCILGQQGLKSLLKSSFQEPRPYVVWMGVTYGIDATKFYELKRGARADIVKDTVKSNDLIPKWQRKHWQAETGYSFPSGHMLFAAGWALLLIGLFWQRRQYTLAIFLGLWAEGIGLSRMLLGMHWPIDILTSTFISGCFALIGYAIFKSHWFERRQA